jgi:hypothetical protein
MIAGLGTRNAAAMADATSSDLRHPKPFAPQADANATKSIAPKPAGLAGHRVSSSLTANCHFRFNEKSAAGCITVVKLLFTAIGSGTKPPIPLTFQLIQHLQLLLMYRRISVLW